MDARSIAAAALLAALVLGGAFLLLDRGPVPLVPLPPPEPRPDVVTRAADPHTPLTGLQLGDVTPSLDAARRQRNDAVRAWLAAREQYAEGQQPQGAVERLEMIGWVRRHATGEATAQEVHQALATLFERELTRRKQRLAQSLASASDVAQAEVLLARERFAAGLPSDYETRGPTYLAEQTDRLRRLASAGVMKRDIALVDISALEEELPPPDVLRPSPTQ